ncbi:hypothetical protein [Paraconexibacter algicola]|uniref:Uncharacterized protein n=1 Tax=Paraconexibacter algicola TaxID=2133960 RepID=A0A2T4UE09_9ACTN|nr:hypothetical protein [Paraconexibacter algicola]PTL55733.1 hypothetical protein C7Y72_19075 [Paraconexibacter algicola]
MSAHPPGPRRVPAWVPALRELADQPGGIAPHEAGRLVHAHRPGGCQTRNARPLTPDDCCQWVDRDGRAALRLLALLPNPAALPALPPAPAPPTATPDLDPETR